MLLAIDVGNTNTVFGIHDGKDWINQWRSATDSTKTADDHASWLWRLADMHGVDLSRINGCVISTVVPQAVFNFRNLARRYLNVEPMFIGDPGINLGMEIRIRRPEQVGADRIVAALGAHRIAASNMMRAIRAVSSERGRDPRGYTLFAFGGNGPLFAATMARALGMREVVIPPSPGLFSAFGLLYADVDLAACVEPKQLHDLVGGYNRFDIFHLTVDRTAQRPIHFQFGSDSTDTRIC